MEIAATIAPPYAADLEIPVDLFVSKKHPNLPNGVLGFVDASGNIVYRVKNQSSKISGRERVLLDASGNPLLLMRRNRKGVWQVFKENDGAEKDMLFRVHRTHNKLARTEFDVFLVGGKKEDSTFDLKVIGCPFQRSCTIYRGNAIVAQTSLMYKLRQVFVSRYKFRLTILPGSINHVFVVALILIFFD